MRRNFVVEGGGLLQIQLFLLFSIKTDMKPFAIYSAMVGAYDQIRQPEVIDPRFDYILFTDDVSKKEIGVWEVRPIDVSNLPEDEFSAVHRNNPTRICRYVKTHAHTLLPEYEASVWMDSNIQIRTQEAYDRVVKMYGEGELIASMEHSWRNCIYEEMYTVLNHQLEDEAIVLEWGHKLRLAHYPKGQGLFETNVIFRRHCSEIAAFNDDWWQCIEHYSKRDQLSFNFVLWQRGIVCASFMRYPEPYMPTLENRLNSTNTTAFSYVWHAHTKGRVVTSTKTTYLYPHLSIANLRKYYYLCYSSPFPSFTANCLGIAISAYRSLLRLLHKHPEVQKK